MNTFLKPTFLLLIIILLAACAAPTDTAESPTSDVAQTTETSSTASTNVPANDKIRLADDYADALPASTQLIIGLLKLEETDLAIDEALATQTLPLWQAYQALSNSDTTAEAELQAVVNQLQDAMSPEQIQAIAALQLTAESAQQMMEEQGIGFGRGGNREGGETAPGGGASGGGVAGLRPGGGQGRLPGEGPSQLDPEARATAVAERFGGENAGAFLERGLLNALIRNLQVKAGEVDPAAQQPPSGRFAARFLESVSEASGVAVETMQAGLDEGKSFSQVITENGGDLDAAREALRQLFADRGLEAEELEQRIDQIMNGGG